MRRLSCVVLSLCLAACATAGGASSDDVVGDDAPEPDANPNDPPDAEPNDPPDADTTPQMVTLSQATSPTVVAPNTLVCSSNLNNVPQYTLENHFYRVFRLSDFGISTTFTAQRVDFAVEDASTTAGSQTVTVRLHTMSGSTLTNASLTLLYGQNVLINDTASATIPVTLTTPVVVPAGSTLVLELFAPAHSTQGNFFYPGSNTSGESGPSYVRADGCSITEPSTYATVAPAEMVHLIMSVTGTKP